jgi:hypothetical protein
MGFGNEHVPTHTNLSHTPGSFSHQRRVDGWEIFFAPSFFGRGGGETDGQVVVGGGGVRMWRQSKVGRCSTERVGATSIKKEPVASGFSKWTECANALRNAGFF